MRVFQTTEFTRDLNSHLPLRERITTFVSNIHASPNQFEADKYSDALGKVRKKRWGDVRLVGRYERFEGEQVFLLGRLLQRSDPTYGQLLGSKTSSTDIDAILGARKSDRGLWTEIEDPTPLEDAPTLQDGFLSWLSPPNELLTDFLPDRDPQICETNTWIEEMPKATYRYSQFCDLLEGIVSETIPSVSLGSGVYVTYNDSQQIAVVYQVINDGLRKEFVLLFPIFPQGSYPIDAQPQDLRGIADRIIDSTSGHYRKSYPAWVLAELETWSAIQRDDSANISLSDEEIELLKVASSNSGESLPLLINGAAGSGKSLMLSYIFASFVAKKYRYNLPGHPIYITYNESLLAKARDQVTNLFRKNPNTLSLSEDRLTEIKQWFTPFKELLTQRLDPKGDSKFFDEQKMIGFRQFKHAYQGQAGLLDPLLDPIARQIPAEMAWYVIRTFIKGFSIEELDPTGYAEVPSKDRVVDMELFETIYSRIWNGWYRQGLERRDLWDEQDLVRKVLETGLRDPADPIGMIVCDEAQDFTRLELHLLFGALHLSQFDLSRESPATLPVVLAGDNLQTLNPTGFRWEATSAIISDLIDSLFGQRRSVNAETLLTNYRSSQEIIRVLNGVQLLRASNFNLKDVRPQRAWGEQIGILPIRYTIGESIDRQMLRNVLSRELVIIPCEEGGEIEYIREDEVLRDLITEEPILGNIVSAAAVKGLEFDKVILWKFGNDYQRREPRSSDTGETRDFEGEYFFNKLYVSMSRAKRELYIFEEPIGNTRLWATMNYRELDRLSQAIGRETWPLDQWACPAEATESAGRLLDSTNSKSQEINADQMFEAAKQQQNASLMGQASRYFSQLGLVDRFLVARSFELEFLGDLREAGRKAAEADDFRRAGDLLWRAGEFDELSALMDRAPSSLIDIRARAVDLRGIADEEAALALSLREIVHWIGDRSINLEDDGWNKYLRDLTDKCQKAVDSRAIDLNASTLFALENLGRHGIAAAYEIAATALFAQGNFGEADRLFCLLNDPNFRHSEALVARAHALGLPRGLRILLDNGMSREVLDLCSGSGEHLDPEWLSPMAYAYFIEGAFERGFSTALRAKDLQRALLCFIEIRKQKEATLTLADSTAFVMELALNAQLNQLRQFVSWAHKTRQNNLPLIVDLAIEGILWQRKLAKWEVLGTIEGQELLQILGVADRISKSQLEPITRGLALEFGGQFVPALKFYEDLEARTSGRAQSAARRGWGRVKNRQFQESRDNRHRQDLEDRFAKWEMSLTASLSVEEPAWRTLDELGLLSELKKALEAAPPPEKQAGGIEGSKSTEGGTDSENLDLKRQNASLIAEIAQLRASLAQLNGSVGSADASGAEGGQ